MKLSATTKLTIAYLAIIFVINLAFSLAIYRSSVAALEEGFLRQARFFQGQPGFRSPMTAQIRLEQLNDGKRDIFINLVGINIAVLILAGLGSHWLAHRTLRPIEEALEAQSRFTADASHELRTPLTALQTEIEVALREKGLKINDAKALLRSNLEEIAKLKALADGLLTLARHQNGEQFQASPLNIQKVIDEAMKRMHSQIDKSEAQISVQAKKQKLHGDFESLVSLIVILIDNAIKYSPGAAEIDITVASESRNVIIKIKDSGKGIKASDLPLIFNRFFRADASRSKSVEGYGLGLSLAKQIVDMHSGNITAVSSPGKGTEFIVKIPIRSNNFFKI